MASGLVGGAGGCTMWLNPSLAPPDCKGSHLFDLVSDYFFAAGWTGLAVTGAAGITTPGGAGQRALSASLSLAAAGFHVASIVVAYRWRRACADRTGTRGLRDELDALPGY